MCSSDLDAAGAVRTWQRPREATRPPEDLRRPLETRRQRLAIRPDETFRPLGTAADSSLVWALSSRGRERTALVAVHPKLGWERVLFEDPQVDVTEVDMSRLRRGPLIARATPGNPRFEILDAKLRDWLLRGRAVYVMRRYVSGVLFVGLAVLAMTSARPSTAR